MLLFLNYRTAEIIGYNEDITREEAEQLGLDECGVWVEGLRLEIPSHEENKRVRMYWTGSAIDYIVEDIIIEQHQEDKNAELIKETHKTTRLVADDNVINMDMILDIDYKVTMLLEHLGIDY